VQKAAEVDARVDVVGVDVEKPLIDLLACSGDDVPTAGDVVESSTSSVARERLHPIRQPRLKNRRHLARLDSSAHHRRCDDAIAVGRDVDAGRRPGGGCSRRRAGRCTLRCGTRGRQLAGGAKDHEVAEAVNGSSPRGPLRLQETLAREAVAWRRGRTSPASAPCTT
jgi:hypothetical protein